MIEFNYIPSKKNIKDICVFGVLKTDAGIRIKQEMLEWLTDIYNVIAVIQDAPGILFEWPALYCAQATSISMNKPILYLHTKGAGNSNTRYKQSYVRKLWKDEFYYHKKDYIESVNTKTPIVACPIISNELKITWWNGFIANPKAWELIGTIQPNTNRFVYEQLFKNSSVNVFGRITSHYTTNADGVYSAANFINNYDNKTHYNNFIKHWNKTNI